MDDLSAELDKNMRVRLLKELLEMSMEEFTEWMEKLLKRMKFRIISSHSSGSTISVTGIYKGRNYFAYIDRKHPGDLTGPEELQVVVGHKYDGKLCKPLYICTSDYTPEARNYAEMVGISLVDSEKLSRLFEATGLLSEITSWKDRVIIEQEGNRWLPSAGELMAYMEEGQDLFDQRKYREAMQVFKKAVELKPNYDAAWRMIGACYHQMGEYESAMEYYKKALSHDETDETYYLMGVTMYELGRYEDEISYYRKALEINSENIKALNNMGTTLYTLRRFDEALSCYDRVLNIDPNDEKVWNNRGVTLKKLGRIDEALKSFERAIELRRDYLDPWINRAALYHEKGRFREAAECWHIVTSQKKDNPVIWYREAEALFNIGQYSMTVTACDEAIRLQNDFKEAIELREKAVKMGKEQGDAELTPPFGSLYTPIFEKKRAEVRPLARGELGPEEFPEEEPEEAIEDITVEEVTAESPEEPEEIKEVTVAEDTAVEAVAAETEEEAVTEEPAESTDEEVITAEKEASEVVAEEATPASDREIIGRNALEERATVLSRLGRTEEAIDVLARLTGAEESADYENQLASILIDAGDLDSAEEHLRRALEIDREYYPARYNLAYLYAIKRNYKGAIDVLSPVPEKDFRLNLTLSLSYIKSEKWSEGLSILQNIAEEMGSEYLWNRLGVALMEVDPEKAGAAFEKAVTINPRFHHAWNNRSVLLYKNGDMEGALKYANHCLKLKPDYGPAWITRGIILQNSSKLDEAVESFHEAHLLMNNRYSAGNLAFAYLSSGDARAGLKVCIDAFEGQMADMDAGCWNLLGLLLMNLGHLESAELCFRKAISMESGFNDAVQNLGSLSLLKDVRKQRLGRYSPRVKKIIENALPDESRNEADSILEVNEQEEMQAEEGNIEEEMENPADEEREEMPAELESDALDLLEPDSEEEEGEEAHAEAEELDMDEPEDDYSEPSDLNDEIKAAEAALLSNEEEFSSEVEEDNNDLEEVKEASTELNELVKYARRVEEEVSDRIGGTKGEDELDSSLSAMREEIEDHFSSLSRKELVEICRKRGIPVAGTKKDLISRLTLEKLNEWKQTMKLLTSVPGVSERMAMNIISVGFSSPDLIKKASIEELTALNGIGPKTAKKIKEAVKKA